MISEPIRRLLAGNMILASLPEEDGELLVPRLEKASFLAGKLVYGANEEMQCGYFPTAGMLSLVSVTEEGGSVELGVVGTEGLVGLPIVLGYNSMPYEIRASMDCRALSIKRSALKEQFDRRGALYRKILNYTFTLLTQIGQAAVCNRFHSISERVCRRLLMTQDVVSSNEFRLTQEVLSEMLGARRAGVSEAAYNLQKAGLIRYSRGLVTILDSPALESNACECYGIIKRSLDCVVDPRPHRYLPEPEDPFEPFQVSHFRTAANIPPSVRYRIEERITTRS